MEGFGLRPAQMESVIGQQQQGRESLKRRATSGGELDGSMLPCGWPMSE